MKERLLEYNCIKLWCHHCLSSLCSSGLPKDTETGDEDDRDMEKHPLEEKRAKNYANRQQAQNQVLPTVYGSAAELLLLRVVVHSKGKSANFLKEQAIKQAIKVY